MSQLTGKRREILSFITKEQAARGFPPSVREIGEAVGLASPSSVQHHLRALEELGYLSRDPSKPRALSIMDPDGVVSSNPPDRDDSVQVPLIGNVAAGTGVLASEEPEVIVTLPKQFVGSGDLFMVQVRGESMIDLGIFEGDYLVVRSQQVATDGDLIVAGINGDEGTVKTFRKRNGSTYLEAANSSQSRFKDPLPFDPSSDRIYGKVVTLLRSLR